MRYCFYIQMLLQGVLTCHRHHFLQSVREQMLINNYSKRTIQSYLYWIKYFILFHKKQHPEALGASHVREFLNHLALNRDVFPATQAIALNALAYLYNHFLTGRYKLMGALLYGSGLRRMERVRLRIGDLDFDHQKMRVWNGKGQKHRLVTMAPEIVPALNNQIGIAANYE